MGNVVLNPMGLPRSTLGTGPGALSAQVHMRPCSFPPAFTRWKRTAIRLLWVSGGAEALHWDWEYWGHGSGRPGVLPVPVGLYAASASEKSWEFPGGSSLPPTRVLAASAPACFRGAGGAASPVWRRYPLRAPSAETAGSGKGIHLYNVFHEHEATNNSLWNYSEK